MLQNYRQKVIGDGKYRLIRVISSGAFGDVYLGKSVPNGADVAVKIESVESTPQLLRNEYKVYRALEFGVGIPRVDCYGTEKKFNFMVMPLLGPSLEELFQLCSRHFTMKTILMLADQMIDRLSHVHAKHFVHGDIKPENFLMGTGTQCSRLFIIDFGLSKKYIKNAFHIPYAEDIPLSGTTRYASINCHKGIEKTRRDELESLGYLFIYFNRGSLPWQNLKAAHNQSKKELIAEKKMSTPVEVLCDGFPAEFTWYINYCRALNFAIRPDYYHLRVLFRELYEKLYKKYQFDYMYDWKLLDKSEGKDGKIKETTKDLKDLKNS